MNPEDEPRGPNTKTLVGGIVGVVLALMCGGVFVCGGGGVTVIALLNQLGRSLTEQFEAISTEVDTLPEDAEPESE